jgi:hypothetical protein
LRVDAQATLANGFLHLTDKTLVPDIDGHHARLWHVHGTYLIDRRHGAIGIHHHRFQHRPGRTARPQRSQLNPQIGDSTLHAAGQVIGVNFKIVCHIFLLFSIGLCPDFHRFRPKP